MTDGKKMTKLSACSVTIAEEREDEHAGEIFYFCRSTYTVCEFKDYVGGDNSSCSYQLIRTDLHECTNPSAQKAALKFAHRMLAKKLENEDQ